MATTLKQKTYLGFIWQAIGQYGSQFIRAGFLLLLAYLLTPNEFGIVSIAMVFILLAESFNELGMAQAIVQRPDVGEPTLSTVFWTNLSVSLLLATITIIGAGLIAVFLGNPDAAPILRVLAVVFPISALSVVPKALIIKQLKFKKLSVRELSSVFAFGIVGLTMALAGAGVWSLVGATLAQRLVSTGSYVLIVSWRPRFIFVREELHDLFSFGIPAMIAAIFSKGITNIDYFVVGRWLGAEALGYYTLAFQLAVIPGQRLMGTLRAVAFPAFSVIQNDKDKLKNAFMEGIKLLFVVLTLLTLLIIVLAPWFINALYGDKWENVILPMQILALAGFFYGFDITQSLYYAVGKPQPRIWIIGFRIVLFIIFVFGFGLSNNIVDVAISLSLAAAISSLLIFKVVLPIVGIAMGELLHPIWVTIRAALLACIPVMFLLLLYPRPIDISPWFVIFVVGSVILVIYIIAVLPEYRPYIIQLKGNILGKLRPK